MVQDGGRAAASVQWGSWAGSGMAMWPGFKERMARMGLGTVQPAVGLSIIARLLTGLQDMATAVATPNPVTVGETLDPTGPYQGIHTEYLDSE